MKAAISILFLVTLAFLTSCSSSPSKNNASGSLHIEDDVKLDDELSDIQNSDFEAPAQISFNPSMDMYSDNSKNDPLSKETMDREDEDFSSLLNSSDILTKAMANCYSKNFNEGLQLFDTLYRQYQKNPSYWNQLGTCYYLKNDKRLALLYYNKARSLDAKYAPAVNNIGVILYGERRAQKALEAFKKARELRPFSKTPAFNLAQIYLKYGIANKAKELFTALLNEHPLDQEISNGLATSHLMLGEIEESLALYETIESKYLSRSWIGINFALALKLNGQSAKARAILSQVNERGLGTLKSHYFKVSKLIGEN